MSALVSMWRGLRRFHQLMAGILVLEYALAFAIVLTATGVLISRTESINQNSGVEEHGLYVLQARGVHNSVHRFELQAAVRRLQSGVGATHVALGSSVPFFGRGRSIVPIRVPGQAQSASTLQADGYEGGIRFAGVLGLRILRGEASSGGRLVMPSAISQL